MNLMIIIQSDPLDSPRGVEAIRMALGLGTGSARLQILLLGNAPLLLTDQPDRIRDFETLEKYISAFEDSESPFYIEERYLADHPEFETVYPYQPLALDQIAQKISEADKFIVI